jgi:hypothetical protein
MTINFEKFLTEVKREIKQKNSQLKHLKRGKMITNQIAYIKIIVQIFRTMKMS